MRCRSGMVLGTIYVTRTPSDLSLRLLTTQWPFVCLCWRVAAKELGGLVLSLPFYDGWKANKRYGERDVEGPPHMTT